MRAFLLSLLILLSCSISAQQNTQHQIDSLRKVANSQIGIEKLETYQLIGSYLFTGATFEELLAYFEELEKIILEEQKKEKNSQLNPDYVARYASMQLNLGYVLYNFGNFDDAEKQARKLMEYCKSNDEWTYYYRGYDLLVEALTASLKHETLQREAKKLYKEAKERKQPLGMVSSTVSLARVYMKQHRFAKAEECFRDAIELANKIEFPEVCYILVESYHDLALTLILQEKYDEALFVLQKTEAAIIKLEEREAEIGHANQIERYRLYGCYTRYYIDTKDYTKAEYYTNLMEEILRSFSDDETVFDDKLFAYRALISEARGQYSEALKLAEKTYLMMLELSNVPMDINDILLLKARLLIKLGRGDESIALYDSIINSNNRIRDTEFNAQLDEIHTIYEVDKHIAEKKRTRNYFLFALGGCILLLIVLSGWIYYSRTIVLKNRGLYRQIKEQDRLAEELESMTKRYEQLIHVATADSLEEIEEKLPGNMQQRKLVARLHEYLLKDKKFSNSDVARDELVSELATNKTYLFESLKAVTGKTPQEYINHLRLEESRRLLDHSSHFTIEFIAEECGFTSLRTFYRIFRENYRITPAEYRKMAMERE